MDVRRMALVWGFRQAVAKLQSLESNRLDLKRQGMQPSRLCNLFSSETAKSFAKQQAVAPKTDPKP